MSFASHNKGLEAFFVDISQRRRQVESATRSRVVYGESIIYTNCKIIVINSTDSNACNLATDTPIGGVKILLNRENLCGHKRSILEISARWSVLLEMVTYETFEVVFQNPVFSST